MQDFALSARADRVDLEFGGVGVSNTLSFTPGDARQLARNLDLYAEKAEIISVRGEDAAVGPREGVLTDLAAWAVTVVPAA